jgi:hypothetical protein
MERIPPVGYRPGRGFVGRSPWTGAPSGPDAHVPLPVRAPAPRSAANCENLSQADSRLPPFAGRLRLPRCPSHQLPWLPVAGAQGASPFGNFAQPSRRAGFCRESRSLGSDRKSRIIIDAIRTLTLREGLLLRRSAVSRQKPLTTHPAPQLHPFGDFAQPSRRVGRPLTTHPAPQLHPFGDFAQPSRRAGRPLTTHPARAGKESPC